MTGAGADRRVLVLSASDADARAIERVLGRTRMELVRCADAESFAQALAQGAGAAVLLEEMVDVPEFGPAAVAIASQPSWSELPLILLTAARRDPAAVVERFWLRTASRVTVLERPIRSATLLAALHTALASRERQYQIRDELERRRAAEAALRASQERLELASEATGFGSYDFDPARGDSVWSSELFRIVGVPESEMPSAQVMIEHVHPDDRAWFEGLFEQRLGPDAAAGHDHEYRIVRDDGETRWVRDVGRAYFELEDGMRRMVRMVGTVQDITARKQVEEALIAKTRALEEEDRRKDFFLATLGHELRNPLAALDLELRLLEEGLRAPEESQQRLDAQVRRLVRLVDDLLEVSRITRGKLALRKEPTDLVAAVRAAAQSIEAQVQSRKQSVALSLPEALEVDGDATRLEQVASNLLDNASKYTPEGGHIEVALRREGSLAVLCVRDTGRGLRQEQLERIFEPFVQEDATSGGLGIGLPLVRGLIALHGGSVSVESEGPGLGTAFTVRLPIGLGARHAPDAPSARPPLTLPRRLRILVIDDNRDFADSLLLVLDRMGAETRCAYTGTEGLELARRFAPEVMLVDLGLPDLSGFAVASAMRARDPSSALLLLAITGFGSNEAERQAIEAGFDARLVKPIAPAQLHALLEKACLDTASRR